MIKKRIEGLMEIHAIVTAVVVLSSFLGTVFALKYSRVVVFNQAVNFQLYFLVATVATLWMRRSLFASASAYGRQSVIDVLRLSANQMIRLAVAVFAVAFCTKDIDVSRLFLLTFLGATGVAVLAVNRFLPKLLTGWTFRDRALRTVIIASPSEAGRLSQWLRAYSDFGVDVVGYIADSKLTSDAHLPLLGSIHEMEKVIKAAGVHQVLVDQAILKTAEGDTITERCERLGCRVRTFVDVRSFWSSTTAAVEQDGPYSFAAFIPEPLDNPLNRAVKRALDIAISLPVVVFVLPFVMLATAIAQRVQSKGPVLYRQLRSGINGRRFYIYKLRTMHTNTAHRVAEQARRTDSRIYPFGAFLRRTSLDELPQFLNVLRGEMSVSGPRPHLLEHDEQFARLIDNYRNRHFVKPGITGLAQSKGVRGEVSETSVLRKRVRYDMHYIARWSLLLDLRIIFNTVRQVVSPPSTAY